MAKKKVKPFLGIRRLPNGKCKPSFASCDEAVEFLGTFTYPEDFMKLST